MSDDCGCLYFGEPDNSPTFFKDSIIKAAKHHYCCECGESISPGDRYEYARGSWDGHFDVFKTCLSCKDIRDSLNCDNTYIFKELWERIADASDDICAKSVQELTHGRAALEEYLLKRDSELL